MSSLLIILSCLVVGVHLIRVGRRGRREGTDPHCPQCDYNLTALTSDNCPECGLELRRSGVVFGQRRGRPYTIAAGVLLLVLAAVMVVPMAGSVGRDLRRLTYRYWPTSWVIDDLSGTKQISANAARELRRRLGDGSLSSRQIQALAQATVDGIVRERYAGSYKQWMLDLSGDLLTSKAFTDAQLENYFRSLDRTVVKYEPYVRDKDSRIRWTSDTMFPDDPGIGLIPVREAAVVSIDGEPYDQVVHEAHQWAGSHGTAQSDSLPAVPQKELVIRMTTRWYDFGPVYSRPSLHGGSSDDRLTHPDELAKAPRTLLCEYVDTLVLEPVQGFTVEVPAPPPPATQPASPSGGG